MSKKILLGIFLILFLTAFFFKVIPVPVENMVGDANKEKFIYGGLIWTSLLEQVDGAIRDYKIKRAYS